RVIVDNQHPDRLGLPLGVLCPPGGSGISGHLSSFPDPARSDRPVWSLGGSGHCRGIALTGGVLAGTPPQGAGPCQSLATHSGRPAVAAQTPAISRCEEQYPAAA